jgi:hypothetical protein
MKSYVDITGSGEDVTIISGSLTSGNYDGSHAVVVGADSTHLSNLTIRNAGLGGVYSSALYLNSKTMYIENVTLKVIGTSDKNYGLYMITDISSVVKNVTVLAIGSGDKNVAIDIEHSSEGEKTIFENVTAKASNATTSNYAISNNRAAIIVRRSTLDATDYGVFSPDNISKTTISQSSILRKVEGDTVKCAFCDDGAGNKVPSSCNNDINGI